MYTCTLTPYHLAVGLCNTVKVKTHLFVHCGMCNVIATNLLCNLLMQKLKEGYLTKAPDLTKGTSGLKVKRMQIMFLYMCASISIRSVHLYVYVCVRMFICMCRCVSTCVWPCGRDRAEPWVVPCVGLAS